MTLINDEVEGFKDRWVEALKSGEFFQCQNNLFGSAELDKDGNDPYRGEDREDPDLPGHCCLGVALEITGGDIDTEAQDGEMPSRAWCAKYGLNYAFAEELASLNDGGSTFVQIAEEIAKVGGEFTPYDLDVDDDEEEE